MNCLIKEKNLTKKTQKKYYDCTLSQTNYNFSCSHLFSKFSPILILQQPCSLDKKNNNILEFFSTFNMS